MVVKNHQIYQFLTCYQTRSKCLQFNDTLSTQLLERSNEKCSVWPGPIIWVGLELTFIVHVLAQICGFVSKVTLGSDMPLHVLTGP